MRKLKIQLVCERCGKSFEIESADAVMPETVKLIKNPLCLKCRIKVRFLHFNKY